MSQLQLQKVLGTNAKQLDREKAPLQVRMKDQQTDQQNAQPQANPQSRPKSKRQIQRQALEAPTPVIEEKTFGVVVLQIVGIAVAIALFFVVLAVVFKRHKFVAASGSDRTLCSSSACDRLAGGLISSLQPGLDPCDDFYAYIQALFASCIRPPVNDSTAPLKAFVDSQGLGFSGKVAAVDAALTMLRLSYLYDVQSVLGAHLLAVMSKPHNVLLRASVNRRYVRWLGEKPDNVSFSYRVLLDVYGRVENADKVVQRISDAEDAEDKDLRYYGNSATKTLLSTLRSSLSAETLHLLVSWDVVRTMAPLVSPATVPGEGGTRYSRCWTLVQRSLGVPAVAAYLLHKLVPNTTEGLHKMTNELRATYNGLFSNEAFIWHAVPKLTLAEFQELQATPLFFPSGVQLEEQLDAFYEAYPYAREDDSFLDTWLKVCRLADETQRNASGLDLGTMLTPNALTLAAATSNRILLPAPALLLPLFSTDALASTNFGGLGHQSSPINDASSPAPDTGGVANVNWTTGIGGVADLVGLHVSYETFSKRLQHRTLPSTNMTEQQVFFAMYCFKFCRIATATGRQSAMPTSGRDAVSRALAASRERCNAPAIIANESGQKVHFLVTVAPGGHITVRSPERHQERLFGLKN
ncbi:hypothetical protein HPB52_001940 [Rhipicephalus sanguineus]|uniref:Uncharacterized protein n=1 Tax=Rhipicephalus sanguineus TaxID=34632 RepID=A0A9D4STQ0_RHISA|nr:hypothetical protein HPB52_001940 [Rhipicephalus sanguineus]